MKKLNFVTLCLMVGLLFEGSLHAQWVQTNNHYRNSVSCFAVSGTNLFAGTYAGGVFRSTNNGTSWTAVNTGLTNTDVHGIHALAVVGSNIFAGTDGSGVFRSTNNGRRWTVVNTGLANVYVYALAAVGSNIFAGTYGGGVFRSTNNGRRWTAVNTGLTNTSVHALAAVGSNIFVGTDGSGVFRSTNNGRRWTAVNTGLPNNTNVTAFAVAGSNIFVGTYSGVFRSTNNGRRWTAVNTGLPNNANVSSFAVTGSDIFVGSGSHGVFLSTNNGTSWAAVNTGLPNNPHYAQAIHGQGFHLVNTSLPNPYVNALAAVGPNIFVGIPGAVFRSTIDGTRWMHTPNNFVRGITLKAPVSDIPRFVTFIDKELAPRGVNTLVLRINYSLQWITHPELNDTMVLKISDALKIKAICKKDHIQLIPLIDLLGHQGGKNNYGALLKAYPEFEENPGGQDTLPNFYLRSYNPRSKVHDVVFDLLNEIIEVFHPKAIDVGMDEVLIIGSDSSKNGGAGQNKSKLFANEVIRLHDFLKSRGVKMWMWGDRLINGEKTGLGRWEASMNDTYRAINMIPKDITISDWHYSVASPGTAAMFAAKGFNVVICPWRSPEVAYTQLENMIQARSAHSDVSKHMIGVLDTFWGNTSKFMDAFEGKKVSNRTLEAYKTFIKLSKNW